MTPVLDPDSDNLPKLEELPLVEGGPKYASWFWGPDDQVRVTFSRLLAVWLSLCEVHDSDIVADIARSSQSLDATTSCRCSTAHQDRRKGGCQVSLPIP